MCRPIRVLELRSVCGTGGGPEKTIMLGAAHADRSRFEIVVCYIRDCRDAAYAVTERFDTSAVDYVEVRERHSLDLSVWPALRDLVHARGIDIVHAHEYKTDLLAAALARATGVIPLATVHGWTGQSRRERLLYYPADKRVLRRYPRLIAVSSEIRDELVRHGADPDRITTVLNGIDPDRFKRDPQRVRASREALGLRPDDVVIGAAGRLERQKRFDLLIETFDRLRRRHARLKLVIGGDGSLRSQLEDQRSALGLADCVVLAGHVSDVIPLYHAFDLFAQSSEYEGTPNAVLEAMALEVPIVATAVGGTAELVRPAIDALVVPAHDVDALDAAVSTLLSDPDTARRLAASARDRVERDLSFTARMKRVEAIYEELAATRARGAAGPSESRCGAL